MVIIDLNQITFSNLFMHLSKSDEVNADLLRYMILNSIRAYNTKMFRGKGEVVIACDSKNNWRKEVFPFYKANRKTDREKSTINWTHVFESFDTVKSELKEFFPYTVIDVERAEADDVIATLIGQEAQTLIVSGDTDFVQLHDNFTIDQYDPVRKRTIQINNPKEYLQMHIFEGDRSDGIPNICSDDDTFVLGKHQKRLTSKKVKYLLEIDPDDYPSVERRNYYRNKQLIDLSCIPQEIKDNILDQFKTRPTKNKSKLFNYFYDRKLIKFMDVIQEF